MLFTPSADQVSNVLVAVGPHKLTSTCLTDCSFVTSADVTLLLESFSVADNIQLFIFKIIIFFFKVTNCIDYGFP